MYTIRKVQTVEEAAARRYISWRRVEKKSCIIGTIRIASRHYIKFYDEQLTMNVVLLHQAINIHNDFCRRNSSLKTPTTKPKHTRWCRDRPNFGVGEESACVVIFTARHITIAVLAVYGSELVRLKYEPRLLSGSPGPALQDCVLVYDRKFPKPLFTCFTSQKWYVS